MPRKYSLAKKLSWRLEYLGYLTMEGILRLVPIAMIDRAGSVIGFLFFYLSPRYRRLAIRNLRLALGSERSSKEIEGLARATCQRTIANFLGTLKTTILPSKKVSAHVTFINRAPLTEALTHGQGAILVLGHMGNWEILNRLHQFLPPGIPAGGIYQPLKNPLVNALLLTRREQDGSRLFNKKDGFHAPASFVKNGGLLIVVADQKVGKAGTPIPFFGRLSTLSPLPALLARKAAAPVFAAGIETVAPGRWRVVFRPLGEKPTTSEIIENLEGLIRRSPSDYLWLHNRWKLHGRYPLSLAARRGQTKPTNASKALRVFILSRSPVTESEVENYLANRDDQDLPLVFELLLVSELPVILAQSNRTLNHLQITAPTPESLAARILELDREKPASPLELVLITEPDPLLLAGAQLSCPPALAINHENLSLGEFLRSLTAAS